MTENPFMKNAREQNWVDDRDIAFAAKVRCTQGRRRLWWGGVWFFLYDSRLQMYEMDGLTGIGSKVDEVDLKDARFIRGSGFVLHPTMRFEANGKVYDFQGFAQAKRVIQAIRESCGG